MHTRRFSFLFTSALLVVSVFTVTASPLAVYADDSYVPPPQAENPYDPASIKGMLWKNYGLGGSASERTLGILSNVLQQAEDAKPNDTIYTPDVFDRAYSQQVSQFGSWSGNEDPSDQLFKIAAQTTTNFDDEFFRAWQASPTGIQWNQEGQQLWSQSQIDDDDSFGLIAQIAIIAISLYFGIPVDLGVDFATADLLSSAGVEVFATPLSSSIAEAYFVTVNVPLIVPLFGAGALSSLGGTDGTPDSGGVCFGPANSCNQAYQGVTVPPDTQTCYVDSSGSHVLNTAPPESGCPVIDNFCPDGAPKPASGICPRTDEPTCANGGITDPAICGTPPNLCPDGTPKPASGVCPTAPPKCPDGSPKPASGICSIVVVPNFCPDGSPKPASGVCPVVVPPPSSPSITEWEVAPRLVRSGEPAFVSWSAEDVSDCTVSGTDNKTWTGKTATKVQSDPILGQTVFSIECKALPGASPTTVSKPSITVNLIPTFQER